VILHRLELRRFLGLADHTFEFAPGFNVVVGPNEAGKSTLRTAIRTVLYENPATASSRYREQFRTWRVDEPPELRLHFELAGRRFTLTKNYATRKVVLADSIGQTWEQHKSVQERLVAALGLPTDDLFDATAHIAQTHLERIHVTSIGKELGTVIGGGGEDVTAALRRLENHIRSLERGSRGAAVKEPGRLIACERRAAGLHAEVEALRRNAAEADRAHAELTVLAGERARLSDEFTAKKHLLENNRDILQMEHRLSALKENERLWERKIRQIQEYTAKLDRLDRDLESATAAGVPSEERVAEGRSVQERLWARERDLTDLAASEQSPQTSTARARRGGVLLIAGILVAAVGAVLLGAVKPAGWILILVGLAALTGGIIQVAKRRRAEEIAAMLAEDRGRRRAALEGETNELRLALQHLLAGLGCASMEEAAARLDGYRELVQERRRIAEFLASLREGSSDEVIVEQWNTIRRDIFGMDERLRNPEIAAKRLTPLEVQTLEREVGELEQALSQKQRREMKLTVDLERLAGDADQLTVKEEQLQDADDDLQRVRRHLDVCKRTLEALQEARRQAEVPVREIAESRAGEYLRVATLGRYGKIRVEGEDLELSVWSDEAAGWVAAEEPAISRGTVDLIYLAVRLALVEVLTHGKRPPLLFDDPFITFDDRRREGAMQLLRELSHAHQVFLFTCSERYHAYADRVIHLPDRWATPEVRSEALPSVRPAAEVPLAEEAALAEAVGPLWERTNE
jgi:DNA repair exonuclease SbcCD ATPase subunit